MKTCFFVSPIGEVGSSDRKRSDTIFNFLLKPICEKYHIEAVRADNIDETNSLSNNIFKNLFFADIVVSDLSNNNPNVLYETAVRHCTAKPIIHIAQVGQQLPFDIKDHYTIFVDHADGNNLKEAGEELEQKIKKCTNTPEVVILNPVTISAKLNNLNITFSLLQSKDELLNEVKNILLKVTDKIENIKPLIEDNPNKKTSAWTGKWISNLGIIDIVQDGNCFSGKYQYNSKDYVGLLEGNFIDDFIVFKWKWMDEAINGVGYWDIGNTDFSGDSNGYLKGRWFYDGAGYSYERLIESLKKREVIEIYENYYWVIYGRI